MSAKIKRKCPHCGGQQVLWVVKRPGFEREEWRCFHCEKIDEKKAKCK